MIRFIQNIGDYFSSNFFGEDFPAEVLKKTGYSNDDLKEFNKRISPLKEKYLKYKLQLMEGRLRTKDRITETHHFHTQILNALGYNGEQHEYSTMYHIADDTVLPIRHTLYRNQQPFLMVMEMQPMLKEGDAEVDGLFEQRYSVEETEMQSPPQKYHRSQWNNVFEVPEGMHISPMIINKAVSELFLQKPEHRPKYILLCAGNQYFLLEQEKWFRGSYLVFDIDELFDEAVKERNYYSLFYFLLGHDTLAPQSEMVLMEQLDEDSHKKAYEVTRDLKEGVINAVEAIANEAVYYMHTHGNGFENLDANRLKDDCLTMVYRLLFLFYAESRDDLDILPSDDEVYTHGYSLEMLRDLEQVPLNTASGQNGTFFHDSIYKLFSLLDRGYRENDPVMQGAHHVLSRTFRIRHLDSPLFDDTRLHYLAGVKLRNRVWQDVICRLSLSKQEKGRARGRISYANLGINQLGSVYESLLAFRGFFADSDYIEVHRKRKANETSERVAATDGSFLVPRHRLDDFDMSEVYHDANDQMRVIARGTFIYRLNGRDRQKSASYYTPEVLTQCTVKYTIKPILERIDKGEMKALDLLDLKILEPAMGAAAFHNEVINQLAEAYLVCRQNETTERVAPDRYREELQKVKAYIALNNVYGVDLNPTAVELGKLSLWLNVIHRDMETPFFGYRLGTGNAVVGAWMRVYRHKAFSFEPVKPNSQTAKKKEWWETAPRHLKFIEGKGTDRKADEVYHFLLPDKNMVPSANIKLLKERYPAEAKRVSEWRKAFCEPLRADEYYKLQRISAEIDRLLVMHHEFQASVNAETRIRPDFFGAYDTEEQRVMTMRSYNEKARLAEGRTATNAPYYKLKMMMDYWCSLWFWDVRQAAELPTRQEWYDDLVKILNIDLEATTPLPQVAEEGTPWVQNAVQGNLFGAPQQLTLKTYKKEKTAAQSAMARALGDQPGSLFKNHRSELVEQLAAQYSFFHYQLEFVEVYMERGGFDVAVGNPPWLKLQFEEKDLMCELFPELEIRNVAAPQVRQMQESFLRIESQKEVYLVECIEIESASAFMNAIQNYPLLIGQQTNLYKCVLENGFNWISEKGYLGLIHPQGVYDDPRGQLLRKEIYHRLKYHFQFQNELMLFSEILHGNKFSINVLSGKTCNVEFFIINNLFHPSTIDSSFIHNGHSNCGGIKEKNHVTNKYEWNIAPHRSRILKINSHYLGILGNTFEGNTGNDDAKLVSIHAKELLIAIEKISNSKERVGQHLFVISEGFHETNDVNDGIIVRKTKWIENIETEFIFSGPHFYVSNPLYKTPTENCIGKYDYDTIMSADMQLSFIPRTNYIKNPNFSEEQWNKLLAQSHETIDWYKSYKLGFSKMLSTQSERTLQPSILPNYATHINSVISIVFEDEDKLIGLCAITSSVILDFYIKTTAKSNLYGNTIENFPLGIDYTFQKPLFSRTLLLNCLNRHYAPLWERHYRADFNNDAWSKPDARLKPFASLTPQWQWGTPLRNWYERRQALVEIDVITAMVLGLTLEELVLIYNVQFPVLQQNEDDTWYDTRGNIVFTCSKGLTGVGVDRPVWEQIRHLPAGQTYEHTIEKSELYYGQKVTYYAPFDKCDRVEDYKQAWEVFEGRFE